MAVWLGLFCLEPIWTEVGGMSLGGTASKSSELYPQTSTSLGSYLKRKLCSPGRRRDRIGSIHLLDLSVWSGIHTSTGGEAEWFDAWSSLVDRKSRSWSAPAIRLKEVVFSAIWWRSEFNQVIDHCDGRLDGQDQRKEAEASILVICLFGQGVWWRSLENRWCANNQSRSFGNGRKRVFEESNQCIRGVLYLKGKYRRQGKGFLHRSVFLN